MPVHDEIAMNANGKKRRPRRRNQKQFERWLRYREKKYLEFVRSDAYSPLQTNHTVSPSTDHNDLDLPSQPLEPEVSKVVVSNLRADAPEFVPRSRDSEVIPENPVPNTDDDDQERDKMMTNTLETDNIEAESVDVSSAEPTKIPDDDDSDFCPFGILSVYARSELHADVTKVNKLPKNCYTRLNVS